MPPDRRRVFRLMARDLLMKTEELGGRQVLKLTALQDIPMDEAAAIVPILGDGLSFRKQDGFIDALVPGKDTPIRLFADRRDFTEIFRRMDGRSSLTTIGGGLAIALSISAEEGLRRARSLFLHLANLGVCAPRDPPRPVDTRAGGGKP